MRRAGHTRDDIVRALRGLPHALLELDLKGRGLQTWIEELHDRLDFAERMLARGSSVPDEPEETATPV